MPDEISSEDYIKIERDKILAALHLIASTTDTKLMFCVVAGFLSVVGQTLVSAKIMSGDDVTKIFASLCADALQPLDRPVQIMYLDGNEKLGSKR